MNSDPRCLLAIHAAPGRCRNVASDRARPYGLCVAHLLAAVVRRRCLAATHVVSVSSFLLQRRVQPFGQLAEGMRRLTQVFIFFLQIFDSLLTILQLLSGVVVFLHRSSPASPTWCKSGTRNMAAIDAARSLYTRPFESTCAVTPSGSPEVLGVGATSRVVACPRPYRRAMVYHDTLPSRQRELRENAFDDHPEFVQVIGLPDNL